MTLNELQTIIESGYKVEFEPGCYSPYWIRSIGNTLSGGKIMVLDYLGDFDEQENEIPFDNMTGAMVAIVQHMKERK